MMRIYGSSTGLVVWISSIKCTRFRVEGYISPSKAPKHQIRYPLINTWMRCGISLSEQEKGSMFGHEGVYLC